MFKKIAGMFLEHAIRRNYTRLISEVKAKVPDADPGVSSYWAKLRNNLLHWVTEGPFPFIRDPNYMAILASQFEEFLQTHPSVFEDIKREVLAYILNGLRGFHLYAVIHSPTGRWYEAKDLIEQYFPSIPEGSRNYITVKRLFNLLKVFLLTHFYLGSCL